VAVAASLLVHRSAGTAAAATPDRALDRGAAGDLLAPTIAASAGCSHVATDALRSAVLLSWDGMAGDRLAHATIVPDTDETRSGDTWVWSGRALTRAAAMPGAGLVGVVDDPLSLPATADGG